MLLKGKRLYLNGTFSFLVAKGEKLLMPHPAKGFIGQWRWNMVENGELYYVLNDETVGFPEKPYFKLHWDFYNTYKTEKIHEYEVANFTPGLYRNARNEERWGFSKDSSCTRAKIGSTTWIYSMPTDAVPEGKYYIEWTVTYGEEVYMCEGYNGIYNIWIDTGNNRWAQGNRESAVPEEEPNQPAITYDSTNKIFTINYEYWNDSDTITIEAGKYYSNASDRENDIVNEYGYSITKRVDELLKAGILTYSGTGLNIRKNNFIQYLDDNTDYDYNCLNDKHMYAEKITLSYAGGTTLSYTLIEENANYSDDYLSIIIGRRGRISADLVNDHYLTDFRDGGIWKENTGEAYDLEPTGNANHGNMRLKISIPEEFRGGLMVHNFGTTDEYDWRSFWKDADGNLTVYTNSYDLPWGETVYTEDIPANAVEFMLTTYWFSDDGSYNGKDGFITLCKPAQEEPQQDDYTLSYYHDNYFGYCAAQLHKNDGNFTTAPEISYTYKLYEYSPVTSQANGFTLAGTAGNLLAQLPTEHAIHADAEYGLYYQDSNWNQVENWNEAQNAFLRLGLNEGAAIDNMYANGHTIVNAEGNELSQTELENLPNEGWAVYTFKSGSQEFDYANLVTIEKKYVEEDGWYVTLTWKDRAFVNWNIPEGKEITLTVNNRPTTTATTTTGTIQYWAGEDMTASYTAPSGEYGRFNINDEDYAKTVNPTFHMEEWRWLMGGEQIRLYAGTDEQLNLNISFYDRDGFSGTINNNLYQSDTRLQFNIEDKLTIGRNISDETAMTGKYVKYVLSYTDSDDNDHNIELNQDEQEEAVIYMKREYNLATLNFQRMLKMLWNIENEKAVFYNRDGNLIVEEAAANVEFTVWDEQQHGYNVNVGTYTMNDNGKIEIPLADIRNALVNDSTFLDNKEISAGTYDVQFKPHVKNESAGWDPWCDYYFQMNEYGNWKLKVTLDDSFAAEWILVTEETSE